MSRIGRNPIQIPAGVTITVADEKVTVKGPKGELSLAVSPRMAIEVKDNVLTVARPSDEKEDRALHGLTRTLINNMVIGVTAGYSKTLEINGVGYKAEKQGTKLVLNLGYSHPVIFEEGDGITFTTPNNTTVVVSGIDKQKVGEMAAKVRSKRPPEPYLGKGIKYTGEHIRRKAGKAGK
ncbi:MAG: 50S ribosomal protein L6 [Clostridia bacterium]|nr:50S ribosomal protein L6 [Clostridia bacterium]MBQ9129997.1 50S ribosomal protein L6 [Clostridia bacterium]